MAAVDAHTAALAKQADASSSALYTSDSGSRPTAFPMAWSGFQTSPSIGTQMQPTVPGGSVNQAAYIAPVLPLFGQAQHMGGAPGTGPVP